MEYAASGADEEDRDVDQDIEPEDDPSGDTVMSHISAEQNNQIKLQALKEDEFI